MLSIKNENFIWSLTFAQRWGLKSDVVIPLSICAQKSNFTLNFVHFSISLSLGAFSLLSASSVFPIIFSFSYFPGNALNEDYEKFVCDENWELSAFLSLNDWNLKLFIAICHACDGFLYSSYFLLGTRKVKWSKVKGESFE